MTDTAPPPAIVVSELPPSSRAFPYFGMPTYDGQVDYRCHGIMQAAERRFSRSVFRANVSSLLAFGFNQMYAHALNMRNEGVTHFVMLHADVVPEDGWANTLIDLLEWHNLCAVSAVLPIKNDSGETSTAVQFPGDKVVRLKRADMVHGNVLFSDDVEHIVSDNGDKAEVLLINTGCLAVKLDHPFAEQLHFNIVDRIAKTDAGFQALTCSEDWYASRIMHAAGVRFAATTMVKALHNGRRDFPNDR